MQIPTAHYLKHLGSPRQIHPDSYIDYLKSQPRFKGGQLDQIPTMGVVLHDTRVRDHLAVLGVPGSHVVEVHTGTTDPNVFVTVYDELGDPLLLINRGLPGGGGITTQVAELGALGVERVVHVGTCALMGPTITSGSVIVSTGSYKDGTAFMLSDLVDGEVTASSYADSGFEDEIYSRLKTSGLNVVKSHGYTIPTFYFQPESLMRSLVLDEDLPGDEKVGFIEMEEAPFFEVARRMGMRAASVVLGSDRYTIEGGELMHRFEDDFDQDSAEQNVLRTLLRIAGGSSPLAADPRNRDELRPPGLTGIPL